MVVSIITVRPIVGNRSCLVDVSSLTFIFGGSAKMLTETVMALLQKCWHNLTIIYVSYTPFMMAKLKTRLPSDGAIMFRMFPYWPEQDLRFQYLRKLQEQQVQSLHHQ